MAAGEATVGQQHPLSVYFQIWILLFVISTLSYFCDYIEYDYLKWTLVVIFMLLKAGLIVAVFMHLMWERLALIYALLTPTLAILVFIGIMAIEADYTVWTRILSFGFTTFPVTELPAHSHLAQPH